MCVHSMYAFSGQNHFVFCSDLYGTLSATILHVLLTDSGLSHVEAIVWRRDCKTQQNNTRKGCSQSDYS